MTPELRLDGRRRWLVMLAVAVSLLGGMPPTAAVAQPPPEEEEGTPDARFEGYPGNIPIKVKDVGGTAGTWAIFIVLAAIGVGVMFKSGNRSHLD